MGYISPREFDYYWSEIRSDARVFEWTTDQQSHYAIREAIKKMHLELYQWLKNNDAVTTNWVDPEIFQSANHNNREYHWGIGFPPNDTKETMFTLRWS